LIVIDNQRIIEAKHCPKEETRSKALDELAKEAQDMGLGY
jgi:uncharacterized protein YbjQ (UPF0145 family)